MLYTQLRVVHPPTKNGPPRSRWGRELEQRPRRGAHAGGLRSDDNSKSRVPTAGIDARSLHSRWLQRAKPRGSGRRFVPRAAKYPRKEQQRARLARPFSSKDVKEEPTVFHSFKQYARGGAVAHRLQDHCIHDGNCPTTSESAGRGGTPAIRFGSSGVGWVHVGARSLHSRSVDPTSLSRREPLEPLPPASVARRCPAAGRHG